MLKLQKKNLQIFYSAVIISATVIITSAFGQISQDSFQFQQCKKLIHKRVWQKAASCCSTFTVNYPHSIYTDNALFWQGFALEQQGNRTEDALKVFMTLNNKYPDSPWSDDASVHQILLAKKLTIKKDKNYINLIYNFLSDTNTTIQFQAALALAQLKDKRAIPVLEQFVKSNNIQTSKLALEAIQSFSSEIEKSKISKVSSSDTSGSTTLRKQNMTIIREKLSRKGKNWTDDELYLNGMFHIVPPSELAFYLSMKNKWDRQEWLRRFWVRLDPTPTTKKNEAREEFRRRVLYAYDHFGMAQKNSSSYYPPWDSRGELYIKFGEPDKKANLNKKWEEWTYYHYKIIFKVSAGKINTDSQGIRFNVISRYIYRHNLLLKKKYFLKKHHFFFIYKPFENIKKFDRFNFYLKNTRRSGSKISVVFNFSFPAWNLKYKKNKTGEIKTAYLYRWVLFNSDKKVILSDEKMSDLTFDSMKELREIKIDKNITLNLKPGSYTLALRIEDINSTRLGIFTKDFHIKEK